MKTGIFLRLYELNITYDRLKADFYTEHYSILKSKGKVIIGKAGAGFQQSKIDSLNEYIKKNEYIVLFLYSSKQKKLYKSSIVCISDKLPSDTSLYPKYYNELSRIKLAFTATDISEVNMELLDSVKLASNKRKIMEVIKSCRTACMIVEYN